MGFETFTDTFGRAIRPRKGLIAIHHYANFGGTTPSGIKLEGPTHLPTIFGVVVAIRHDSELCVLHLDRDAGGIMPGDLLVFPRYAAGYGIELGGVRPEHNKVAEIPLIVPVDKYNEETREWYEGETTVYEDVFMLAEEMVWGRLDEVIEDPWAKAVAKLQEPVLISG